MDIINGNLFGFQLGKQKIVYSLEGMDLEVK
jgi:hypothetical protein